MEQWLAGELTYSDSQVKRFGFDEEADADLPRSHEHATSIPGGYASGSVILPRPANLRADDAALFSHYRAYGPGGRTAYEGRVSGLPQVGVNEVRLDLEGWSAELDDDETFAPLFVNSDFSSWSGYGVQRELNYLGGGTYSPIPPRGAISDEENGNPALALAIEGPWGNAPEQPVTEAWFDAGSGRPISSLYYAWKKGPSIDHTLAGWHWFAYLSDNDVATTLDATAEMRAAGPSSGVLVATTADKRYAIVQLYYNPGTGSSGVIYPLYFTCLAAYGNQGLTKHGTATLNEPQGYLGSDLVAYALSGTSLNYSLGDSIEPSAYPITHLDFRERGTRRQVFEQVTALGSPPPFPNDWGVYDNKEAFWRSPGSYGKTWRVRRDQTATPTSEGPQSKKRIGGMMISYRDGAGVTHSVGPPGSGADYETAELLDSDPSNPANRLQRKWAHRQVGITNREGALNIARMLLADANNIGWKGDVEIAGEATDAAGNTYPASLVKAGDRIVIEDDEAPEERPINSTSYSQDGLKLTAHVGELPDRGEVLLAQLVAATDLVAA